MDSSSYRHLLSKIKKSNTIPHHNFPCHNLLSVENLLGVSVSLSEDCAEDDTRFLAKIPCYQQFPYVVSLSVPLLCGSGLTDEAHALVRKKLKWQKDLKTLKLYNVDKAIKQIKDLQQDKAVKISKNLKKYINHFSSDPEPMFCGSYNWLYSSGTLSCTETLNGVTLISADTFEGKPGFNILKFNQSLDEIRTKDRCLLKNTSPVLQTACKSLQDTFVLCVRQKNHLSLYRITERDSIPEPIKLWRKKVNPPKLITCADINTTCKQLLLADTNHDLHVFDVERRNKVYAAPGRKIFPDSTRDPWSQVAFGDLGLYVAFRNCFVIIDPRECSPKTAFDYSPAHAVNNCEDVCSFATSSCDPNFLYLGTSHSILQVDLRNGETVQRWTHLMKQPPQFLTAAKDGGESEVVLVQSQEVGEVVGIGNECRKEEQGTRFLSRSLPCLLGSVKESLTVARFEGVCLRPGLPERIDFGITGMQCLRDNAGHLNVFTNNSGGDLFLSKINKRHTDPLPSEGEENRLRIVNAMKVYESQLNGLTPRQQSANPRHLELTDMSHVLDELRRGSRRRPRKSRKAEIRWRYHEMYSPESLEFYKDLLARKILKVWGYEGRNLGAEEAVVSVDEKVREWMDKN